MPRKSPGKLQVWRVGMLRYDRALALQRYVMEDRILGHDDVLISVQHPPAITLGRHRLSHAILTPHSELRRLGIEIYHTDRRGEVTMHLPGQPVLYPIVSLRAIEMGLRNFLEVLEDVMLGVAKSHGIDAEVRVPFEAGCWIERQRQIGAIGLRLTGGVTTHGLAFNAKPDLGYFSHIVPCCGLAGKEATSLAKELGSPDRVDEEAVTEQLIDKFVEIMGYKKVANRSFNMEKLVPSLDRLITVRAGDGGRRWLLKLKEMDQHH
ncbi:hypothetical protein SELMODRAFT_84542 [Selaginella moellendorffii]|uniref:lipoyl(octanoyl) transferase n=1 Tax=Selaginella moellendorffii TaxID=88036 RepID=D8R3Q9_SELML|nr:octanoyltransferase [Selaginella moellendorffii]XP_024526658.1 octanoyltransferase [Selaginella moellendorffii]EFJ33326.1 hypothetical protein SELMODRAFT_84542 [Selaginella moellendorffii]|eukprot:XP_002965906.1 octanoyltransferase [Selaginella moellendorffii]